MMKVASTYNYYKEVNVFGTKLKISPECVLFSSLLPCLHESHDLSLDLASVLFFLSYCLHNFQKHTSLI